MTSDVVSVLRGQLAEVENQAQRLRTAIAALEGGGLVEGFAVKGRRHGRPSKAAKGTFGHETGNGRKKKRKFSAATRAKMAAAQKARWAKKG